MIRISRMTIVTIIFMLCLSGLVLSGTAFAQQCVDNGDGTITDNGAGLMWQKATNGLMDWNTAMSYASGLSLGGHSDWRLPNRDELKGLYNSECKKLMEVRRDWYWSSTTYASDTDYAWFVDFNYGGMSGYSKSYNYFVRAVRDVQ